MSTQKFLSACTKLSPIQKKAVQWNEGALLVLAGPGSGKTNVLTCRIARILESSINKNFRILGLTFTNKAADEMRERVEKFIPGQKERLFLGTFHSFCADILRQHGTHLGIAPNFKIYSQQNDLQALLNDAVEEAKKNHAIVTDKDKKLLPVIKMLKSRLISPQQCFHVFSEREQEFIECIAIIYRAYEEELSKHNALDFDSLIFKTYELLKKYPSFSKRYRTVYPFICIDEFQDTNEAQYALIQILTGQQYNNLFVVADDDQIIYQWNGASHKRIEEFIKDYSPDVIQLPVNYRCPFKIVELANNLIEHNFLRNKDKKPLKSFYPQSDKNTVRLLPVFPDFDTESKEVARDIKNLHSHHFGSVVVLTRSRRLLNGALQSLKNEGISAVISQRRDEFESTPFIWLHSLLKLANDRQNRKELEAVCGTFAQLTQIEVDTEEVIEHAQGSSLGFLQHWISIVHQKNPEPLLEDALEKVSQFLVKGRDLRAMSKYALNWFGKLEEMYQKTSSDPTVEFFAQYKEEQTVWNELMKEITNALGDEITLEAFLQELEMRSKEPPSESNTVLLMTIHGSKGKEFDHVYLLGLVEDELPSFQSKLQGDRSPEMEEERRNCFVVITRTIKTLTLSYAERYNGWSKKPSRFLSEMGLVGVEVKEEMYKVAYEH